MEHALTEEFKLPCSNAVQVAFSEAMVRHHANPDHVFNSIEFCEAQSEEMSEYWSDQKNCKAQSERKIALWADTNSAYNS